MASRFILLTAALCFFLIPRTELLAQQKAPVDSGVFMDLSGDMDETVMTPVEPMPDTPAEPIILVVEEEMNAPFLSPTLKKATKTRAVVAMRISKRKLLRSNHLSVLSK